MTTERVPWPDAETIYEVRNLVKIYRRSPRPVTAVSDVTLDIRVGQRLGIVGESGSGKSTLIRMLAALSRPTSGEIRFAGESIVGRTEADLAWENSRLEIVIYEPDRASLFGG